MKITNWFNMINTLCEELKEVIINQHEFECMLANLINNPYSPIEALSYKISLNLPYKNFTIGTELNEEPMESYIHDLKDKMVSQCKVRIWRKLNNIETQEHFESNRIRNDIIRLIDLYWKPDIRDELSGLPLLQSPGVNQLTDNSIKRCEKNYKIISIFFCDLDNFKKVNDEFGMQKGDNIILHFAALIDSVVKPEGIAFRRSAGADEGINYMELCMQELCGYAERLKQPKGSDRHGAYFVYRKQK